MDAETAPTTAQRMWVYALHGLYNDPGLSEAERRRGEQIVEDNEISLTEKEDFATVASYLLDEYGKWTALETIYQNFERQRLSGGELGEWPFVAVAEFAEVQYLVQDNEYGPPLTSRMCPESRSPKRSTARQMKASSILTSRDCFISSGRFETRWRITRGFEMTSGASSRSVQTGPRCFLLIGYSNSGQSKTE